MQDLILGCDMIFVGNMLNTGLKTWSSIYFWNKIDNNDLITPQTEMQLSCSSFAREFKSLMAGGYARSINLSVMQQRERSHPLLFFWQSRCLL